MAKMNVRSSQRERVVHEMLHKGGKAKTALAKAARASPCNGKKKRRGK
jgi:hypothetical protein